MVGLSTQQPIRLSVKRNVVFNVIGGVWTIIVNLLAVRFQLHILGTEAYGLISFGASLQIFFLLFEMGISTLIIREVAKDHSSDLHVSHSLLQTAVAIFWTVAICLGIIIFFSSNWLVMHWITLEHISSTDAEFVIRMWAIALAFNHPMILYFALMSGLQRLDIGNLVRAGVITTYLGGGIILLVLTQSMILYMLWNAITSIGGLVVYAIIVQRLVKGISLYPRFSLSTVRRIWRPTIQLGFNAIITIIFTQLDRIFISHLLPVKELGFYAAAYTLIMGISFLQGFITSAFMPALAADYGSGDTQTMRIRYYKLTQLLVYLIGLFACGGIFLGRDLLSLWTNPETATGAYQALALLVFGALLNASMAGSYVICVVTENLRYPTRVNFGAVWIYIPLLYILTSRFGIQGAALTYVLLNIYYIITLAIIVQRNVLKDRIILWFRRTLIPFFALSFVFWIGSLFAQGFDNLLLRWFIYAINFVVYLLLGFAFLDHATKDSMIKPLQQFTITLKNFAFK